MDKRVTPPKRVTSPTWGTPPPCKQALTHFITGSRGDVIVVRKSKPVEKPLKKWVILVALQFCYTFYRPQN